MSCLDDNTLVHYLEGMLTVDRVQAVEEHLAGCAKCRWLLSVAAKADAGADGASLAPTQQLIPEPAHSEQTAVTRIGEILQDTYVVERFIGRGGMGTVYEASHRRLRRRFAIKFLTEARAGDAQAVARLRLEAEVTSQLAHPNIVEVTDFNYTEDGAPYIVMELLEGESLDARLRREGRLDDMSEVATIASQTLSALQAAHQEGIIHRDLKPTNIFLLSDDAGRLVVKVMDFGISKVLGTQTGLTADVAVMGSPRYMAPEQALGRSAEVDLRADIFAVGTIIFEMLCGVPPFIGDSVPETLFKVVYQEPSKPPIWRRIPLPLRRVVRRALSKDPAERPASMAALWEKLSAALYEIGVEQGASHDKRGETTSMTSPQPISPRRSSGLGLVVAAVILLAAGVTMIALLWETDEPTASTPPAAVSASDPDLAVNAVGPPATDAGREAGASGAGPPAARLVRAPPGKRPRLPIARSPRTPGEAARAHARPTRRRFGRLTIQSKDADDGQYVWANVFIDGKLAGQTALTLDRISAGRHRVELRRPGYHPVKRWIRVRPGRSKGIRFQLRRTEKRGAPGLQ